MELTYRRAQLLELSRILAQCFENVNHYEDFARVDRSEALSAVRRRVQKQIFNFTIAEKDGEAVGCYFLHNINGRVELEDFYVFDPHRGRGIGTALLRGMLRRLRCERYDRISLSVQKANPAVNLYRREGFSVVAETDEEYVMVCPLR